MSKNLSRNYTIKHNKYPIKQSLRDWINNYPESFHPCDMNRFYSFVKCICRYSRKQKGYQWLEKKLKQESNLNNEKIKIYCDKFVELQKFYKTPRLQIYKY